MRKQATPSQTPSCVQALPDSQALLPEKDTVRWQVTGQGRAVLLFLGPQVPKQDWDSAIANWAQHFQVLVPSIMAPTAGDARLLADLRQRLPKQPLYVIGLHGGCALACQLAMQWPQLSGLVLLDAAGHGCTLPSVIPSTDIFPNAASWTQLDVPILSIWHQAVNQADPTEAAIALAQDHEQHEWMVIPSAADHHTIGQIIVRWLQSHA